MSCTKCKQKNKINKDFLEGTEIITNWVGWFLIVWSMLAIYGIYNLIIKLL